MNFVKAVRRILLIKTLVIPTKAAESGGCGLRENGNGLLRCSENEGRNEMNETKKALACCVNAGNCVDCPLNRGDIGGVCVRQNMIHAVELINHYEAEIERLKCDNSNIHRLFSDACKRVDELDKLNETVKAEAIKEFAERLEQSLERQYNAYGRLYVLRHIEKLVKEMVGEG